jgi:hypothetical protein
MTPTPQETEALLKRINNDIEYFDGREDKQSVDYEFGNLELTVGDLKTIRAVLQSHAQKVGADIGIKCERHIYGNMAPWPRKCLNGCNGDEFDHTQEEAADSIKNILAKKKPASDGSEQLDVEALKREIMRSIDDANQKFDFSDEPYLHESMAENIINILKKRNFLRGRGERQDVKTFQAAKKFIEASGFVIVPREPTVEQLRVGEIWNGNVKQVYYAMISASEGRETG